jgi:hypothetical protein
MITGLHAVLHSRNADAIRIFFRDTLPHAHLDAGGGQLIFAMPPTELAIHPTDSAKDSVELYLMCDNLASTMNALAMREVEFTKPVREESWGRVTAIRLADGSELGLYEPKHAVIHEVARNDA